MKKLLVFLAIAVLIVLGYVLQTPAFIIFGVLMTIVALLALLFDSKTINALLVTGALIESIIALWAIVYACRLITIDDTTHSLIVPTDAKFAGMLGLLTFALSMLTVAIALTSKIAKKQHKLVTFKN
jgi:hypothetical protein